MPDLQHGDRRVGGAPGCGRVWEGVGDKGEVGPAVLDAALGEAPIRIDKGLCGGIGLGRLGDREGGAGGKSIH